MPLPLPPPVSPYSANISHKSTCLLSTCCSTYLLSLSPDLPHPCPPPTPYPLSFPPPCSYDIAWKHVQYGRIWEFLRSELEMDARFKTLDMKLNLIQDNLKVSGWACGWEGGPPGGGAWRRGMSHAVQHLPELLSLLMRLWGAGRLGPAENGCTGEEVLAVEVART